MQNLRVSFIQSNLHWENPTANRAVFAEKIKQVSGQTDLIILPEMFTTGFSMNTTELAEPMDGATMEWMSQQANSANAVVTGSFIATENGQYFNRLIWMRPDGTFSIYDKKHLFTLAKEHDHYSAGTQRLIVELKGWKICPLICYDLRFPVWSRNTEDYDLLIYTASWPVMRAEAWKALLVGRAIENQSYTVGVNRVGVDGGGYEYSGDSSVIDYAGKRLYCTSNMEDIFTATLDFEKQKHFRSKLNFLADRDEFHF